MDNTKDKANTSIPADSLLSNTSMDGNEKRSCIKRTFGTCFPGSLRVGIFTMVACTLGAAVFSLPLIFSQIGLVFGILLLLFTAGISWLSMKYLILISRESGVDMEFADLIKQYFGPIVTYIFEAFLIIDYLGAIILYQILIVSVASNIMEYFSFEQAVIEKKTTQIIIMALITVTNFLISFKKDLHGFRHLTTLSIVSFVYILGVVIIETPFFIEKT